MKQYDRTNTGTLGRNTERKSDKHPEYTGSLNVGGVEYWLSGWVRVAGESSKRAGEKFISMKLEPKEQQPAAPARQAPAPQADLTDDVPF